MRRSSFWLNVRLLVPWVRSVRTTIHYVDNTLSKISAISSLEDRSPCGPLGRSERTINWSYWWQYLMTYRMLHRGLLYLSRFIWSIKMWGLCTAPLCCQTLMFYVLRKTFVFCLASKILLRLSWIWYLVTIPVSLYQTSLISQFDVKILDQITST